MYRKSQNNYHDYVEHVNIQISADSSFILAYSCNLKNFKFLVTVAIMDGRQSCQTQFWMWSTKPLSIKIWIKGIFEDFKVIFFNQNKPNLHNGYKSTRWPIVFVHMFYLW